MSEPAPFVAIGQTEEGRALAAAIRMVALDVDGVLTDGGIYLGDVGGQPMEFKRYEIQDGLAVGLLRRAGIKVAIITGRDPSVSGLRAEDLQVDAFAGDPGAKKIPLLDQILKKHGIDWRQAAFVGDDLPDIPVMRRVGLAVAVANAAREVREIASWTTIRSGGHGAIREFTEAFLTARGQWREVMQDYLKERGDDGGA